MEQFIAAGEFKAKCLKIMEEVNASGKQMIITKRNVPVVKLCPIKTKDLALYGKMKGSVEIKGDIIHPIGEAWDADR